MPVFDVLERTAITRFNVAPGLALRFIVRSAYVGKNLSFIDLIRTYKYRITTVDQILQLSLCLLL